MIHEKHNIHMLNITQGFRHPMRKFLDHLLSKIIFLKIEILYFEMDNCLHSWIKQESILSNLKRRSLMWFRQLHLRVSHKSVLSLLLREAQTGRLRGNKWLLFWTQVQPNTTVWVMKDEVGGDAWFANIPASSDSDPLISPLCWLGLAPFLSGLAPKFH